MAEGSRAADGARSAAAPGSSRAPVRSTFGPVRVLWCLAAGLMLVRLVSLGLYPLMDTSEARYGEIARVMLATGDFVTPQEVPGTPFWAKPPLYAWLSAGAMQVLGIGEFALRLPSWLLALAVLALCVSWVRTLRAPDPARDAAAAALVTALLCVALLFFVAAGTVMTDPSLAACITAMLLAFHRAVVRGDPAPRWRWAFFVAAGFGMLAKGPVIALYVGAPILLWAVEQGRVRETWARLPWVGGSLLAGALCLPWYALAEQHTPGFLRYFLLGEHLMRFLKPGWGGDLYGTAHAEPIGTIWAFLAGGLGLAMVPVLAAAWRARRAAAAGDEGRSVRRFLLYAALVPLAVFTFAGNIIWTYTLPALGPLLVWTADGLAPVLLVAGRARAALVALLVLAGLLDAGAVLGWAPHHVGRHSAAALLAAAPGARAAPGSLVYWGRKAPASLRFYSQGTVRVAATLDDAVAGLLPGGERLLAFSPPRSAELDAWRSARGGGAPAVEPVARNEDLVLVRLRLAH